MVREQFRIYRRDAQGELGLVATCGSKGAVGVALVTLGEEGEFEGCTVGVMHRPHEDKPGRWLANPYPAGIPRTGDRGKSGKRRKLEGKHSNKEKP